jgi:hypothetical protein
MLVLGVSPAAAQLSVSPGWSVMLLDTEEPSSRNDNVFGELEFQTGLGDSMSPHWLAAMVLSDGDAFAGGGLRYYHGREESAAFWGFGIAAVSLGEEQGIVARHTVFVGAEFLLELWVPYGNEDAPVTAFAGAFPSVAGDDGTLFRFGIKLSPDLVAPKPSKEPEESTDTDGEDQDDS